MVIVLLQEPVPFTGAVVIQETKYIVAEGKELGDNKYNGIFNFTIDTKQNP